MTDRVVGELADSGHQGPGEYQQARQMERWNFGETELIPQEPRLIDLRARLADGHPARPAVERAVAAAWRLAATAKPPPGSVRSRGAWPRPACVISAVGDKWRLAGRTGGPVILLLDELAGVPADTLYWFNECGRTEGDTSASYLIEGTVTFENLQVMRADAAPQRLDEFIADGQRQCRRFSATTNG
jgi:hypothetical protein